MDAGLLYQNAKIKSKEALLLGEERLQRVSDAASLEEATRLLTEAGYPAAATPDEMLLAAEREASLLFKSSVAEGYGLELFLIEEDYHNAKVAAKAHYFGGSKEGYKPEGLLTHSSLEEALEKGEYRDLPALMAEVFADLDKAKGKESLYPSDVDASLDKALFTEIKGRYDSAAKVFRRYFDLAADLKNISVAYRAGRAALSREKAERMFLPCGTLSAADLLKIREFGEEAAEKVASLTVKGALAKLKEGTVAYEKYMDDALLAILKKERYDMFSPAPIAGFYIGKTREIKNVRLILARIANGVDKETVKARMRELYV